MSAHVIVKLFKLHAWPWDSRFNVYHGQGQQVDYLSPLEGKALALWSFGGQKAGFGFGRFGYRSFGWGQGISLTGGFGQGYFGYGEFGYFNEVAAYQSSELFSDGMHSFGVKLFDAYGNSSVNGGQGQILIISTPEGPRNLKMILFAAGKPTVTWSESPDV